MLEHLLAKYEISRPSCSSELPAGWAYIVDELIDDLIELGWDKDLHQVKEEFGGLRFYIGAGSPEVHDRITLAEQSSFKVCIDCGSEDDITRVPGHYILFTCPTCKERYK